ncbi:META domain-containing protein [Photobacterium damselae]|uniref:META domain-containing protein n=1 Tax=Photobacterium damselae TaxID=38293 RepID=UPI00165D52A6|nr:META domain-containing protein [Photobacterium damselae]
MKYIKVLILALLSTTLVGCFSNQQLNESTKFIGDWTLKGGVNLPGITKRQPNIVIENNMTVSGFTGCNTFKGKLNSVNGQSTNFTLPAVTRKMCLPELITQENNMLNILRSATSIELINHTLVVDSGDKFLVFEKTN